MWKDLPDQVRAKYFDKAKQEEALHKIKYPGKWINQNKI